MKLLQDLCEHLHDININWYLCGGFAIDVYLGKSTRNHKDLDITIRFEDMIGCIEYLKARGWEIDAPIGGKRVVPVEYALAHNELYFDNIWCYKKDASFIKVERTDGVFKYVEFSRRKQIELDFLEVLFNRIDKGTFYYKRDPMIKRDTDKAFIKKDGISILAPELVLLYKSKNYQDDDNQHDFHIVIDKMEKERYDWFMNAMRTAYPEGHLWIR
ncbi:MAG: nucleotidyltransferase domain-containing protein [Bacillota bacterium]